MLPQHLQRAASQQPWQVKEGFARRQHYSHTRTYRKEDMGHVPPVSEQSFSLYSEERMREERVK